MPRQINWLTDLAAAREQARTDQKPILLDFFNPE